MRKEKVSLIISILDLIILVGVIVFLIISNLKLTPNKIFKNNLDCIVEIKASTESVGESYGSAIIYDESGLLITNSHVISYTKLGENILFDNFEIRFPTKEDYQSVSFVDIDYELDLAILKIDDQNENYKVISFSSAAYTYGDKVYAIGNTSNYGIGISEGIISVPEVNVIYNNITRTVIQSDISIASGNSGGALLDSKGKLIGITTFRTKDLSGNVNYGYAYSIPVRIVKEFIKEK